MPLRCYRLLRFYRIDATRDDVIRRLAVLLSAFARLDYARQAILRVIRTGTLVARDTERIDVRDTRGTGVLLSRGGGTVRGIRRLGIRGNRRRWLLHGCLRRPLSDDSRCRASRRAVHVTRHRRVRAIINVIADGVAAERVNDPIRIATVIIAVVAVCFAAIVESPG